MKIQEKTFELEQVKGTLFFNLSILTLVNEGKDTERSEMKLVGYGLPLSTCLQEIVSKEIEQTYSTLSLSEYVTIYTQGLDKLSQLIKQCISTDQPIDVLETPSK